MKTISVDVWSAKQDVDPVERFILRLAAYEPIESAAREALRRAVQLMPRVPAREVQQDNVPADLCVLLSGWICHFRLFDNGRRQITSLVVPGDLIDFSFLTGGTSALQFRATTPSQLGRIPLGRFTAITEEFPSVMRAALRASGIEATIREERVVSLGVRSAIERVGHLLCELWHRLNVVGLVDANNSYLLPMTQAEMGEALGLSVVHVNRTLQAMRRDGVITLKRGKVILHHPTRLAGLAGFDAAYLGGG